MSPAKFLIILFALFIMLAGLVLIYLDIKSRKRKNLKFSDDLNDKDGIPIVPRHLRKFSQEDQEENISKDKVQDESESITESKPPVVNDISDDTPIEDAITEYIATEELETLHINTLETDTLETDTLETDTLETDTNINDVDRDDTQQSEQSRSINSNSTNPYSTSEKIKISTEYESSTEEELTSNVEPVFNEKEEQELLDKEITADVDFEEVKINHDFENVGFDSSSVTLNHDTSSHDTSDDVLEESKELEEQTSYSATQVPVVKISNAATNSGLFYSYDNSNATHDADTINDNDNDNDNIESNDTPSLSAFDEYEDDSQNEPSRVHTSAFQKGFDIARFTDSNPVREEPPELMTDHQDQNSPLTHARDNLNISILPINEFSHISGEKILQMVDDFGFKYGAMNMFHRYQDKDGSGVLWFSMMALTKDGIQPFDINSLATSMDIKGLVMFLPLPHPKVLQGFDSMMSIAGLIARDISGFIVDEDGNEITTDYKKRLRALLQSSLEDS